MDGASSNRPSDNTYQMGWVLIALQNAFYLPSTAESLAEGVRRLRLT